MKEIDHTYSEITEQFPKPVAIANQSFPYTSISDDRRFEELLYTVIKAQLGSGDFANYDNISLMSGVGEKGRDCTLFQNSYATGVIQCKMYSSTLNKVAFGKEITKFVLHSLLDKTLLPDPQTFTYYIAIATKFSTDCSDFIDTFSKSILSEPKLSKWIEENIKAFKGLKSLELKNANVLFNEVKEILSSISVKKISAIDLDRYLAIPNLKHLISLFFEVKTIADNSEQHKTNNVLERFSESFADRTNVEQELDTGSLSLKSEINEFAEIPDSHIKRHETEMLFQWIISDLKTNQKNEPLNLHLLAGNAGMGKTVILKDLYDKLKETDIAVLGLKADKLASTSVKELQDKIGLSIPFFDFIEKCKLKYNITVIIIDQIDALSQSMSSDRSYLQVFKNLVTHYLKDEKIRIIVSTRLFDLNYDPSLQTYKKIQTITVAPLSKEQVLTQLKKLEIYEGMLSQKLLDLLKIPNHLNVFSKIYNGNQRNLGILTLQDMYRELWTQKVINLSTKDAADQRLTKELIYKIARKMFQDQKIAISESPYEDYTNELRYLLSTRLLKNEDRQLQFFHQSFYDFVFAKQFVESEQDLCKYITENGQTLLLRSAVKMILNYLRDYDEMMYLKAVSEIFDDNKILYHIKHMTLSSILFNEKPLRGETEVVHKAITGSYHLLVLFFEKSTSENWFQFATDHHLLDILKTTKLVISPITNLNPNEIEILRTSTLNYLRSSAFKDYPRSWELILQLSDQTSKRYILRTTINWDNPITYQVFNSITDFKNVDPYAYYRTINNIASANTEYALKLVPENLYENKNQSFCNNNLYDESHFFRTLMINSPEKLYSFLLEELKNNLSQNENGRPRINAYKLMELAFQDRTSAKGNEFKYIMLALCLQKIAKLNVPLFLEIFEQHKYSVDHPILRLLIFALKSNEAIYVSQISDLISHILTLENVYYNSNITFEARNIFEKAFPLFSPIQQNSVIDQIKELNFQNEIVKRIKDNGKQGIATWYGLSKYCWLKRLPKEIPTNNKDLKKLDLELTRRFADYQDKEKSPHAVAGVVQRPLPKNAYKFMSVDQWISSFKKYNGTIDHFARPFLKGDIDEHANAFRNCAKETPSDMIFSVIQKTLENPQIDLKYAIYGIWGWSESNGDKAAIIPLFTDVIERKLDPNLKRICSYVAENLITENKEDKRIINFLLDSARSFQHEDWDNQVKDRLKDTETSIGNLVTTGLNTISGGAVAKLVHVTDPVFLDEIFETLKMVLNEGPAQCRAAILYEYVYLMNIDEKKAFEIFKNHILKEQETHVLAASLWSLQYIGADDYISLYPVYKTLTNCGILGQDDSRWLFTILLKSYIFDQPDGEDLLLNFVDCNKYVCSFAIEVIFKNYYLLPGSKLKNNKLLNKVLEKVTDEDFDNDGINFNASLEVNLTDIKPFLNLYIASPYFKLNDSFVEYLTVQCISNTEEAIAYFNEALKSNQTSDNFIYNAYLTESGLKFIINAFNSLIGNDQKSEKFRWELMLTFDKLLQDPRFKEDSELVLDELV